MARSTTYNNLYSEEIWNAVNKDNKTLLQEFIYYKRSSGKAESTTNQYFNMLRLFFIWNKQFNEDKFFKDITKRDLIRYINYMMFDLKSSSNRIRTVRSAISSLGEYMETMSDEVDEWEGYRNIALKIEVPKITTVRKKTVLDKEQIDECLNKLVENGYTQTACYMALAAACGARKSELLRFKCEYINEDRIKYGMYVTPEIVTKGNGREGKLLEKYVLINQFKPYYDLWMKERKEKGIESEWMFVTVDKNNVAKKADVHIADYWAEIISKYMNCDFYFHSLRHYWTTSLKKQNIPDTVIQVLQGWASVNMVNIYSDIKVDDILGEFFDDNGVKEDIKMGKLNNIQ